MSHKILIELDDDTDRIVRDIAEYSGKGIQYIASALVHDQAQRLWAHRELAEAAFEYTTQEEQIWNG